MTAQLNRLSLFFVLAFAAVALAAGYWAAVRPADLLNRADNPRRVLFERRVPRGHILDRSGAVLAETVGAPGALERHYPYPALAPVLGYISPLYGAAGIEAALDPVLHGDEGYDPLELYWRADLLGAPPPGRGVQLTIDLRLQRVADEALGAHAGAIVLLDAETGEILALASHPTYDPNTLEADWEDLLAAPDAPLLNRATLALYQPGGALWPLVLAGAFEAGYGDLAQPVPFADMPVEVDDHSFGCRMNPRTDTLTLTQTLQLGCPWPVAALGSRLGEAGLLRLYEDFRLGLAPGISIPSTAGALPASIDEPRLAAIGQGELTVTPLHMALAAAAIARDGALPAPVLVAATQSRDGQWQPAQPPTRPAAALAPDAARQVKALMPDGYRSVALTGAEGQRLAWFLGFAPYDDPRYAVAVLVEDGDLDTASGAGRALLAAAVEE